MFVDICITKEQCASAKSAALALWLTSFDPTGRSSQVSTGCLQGNNLCTANVFAAMFNSRKCCTHANESKRTGFVNNLRQDVCHVWHEEVH